MAMRRFLRTSLPIIASLSVLGVLLKVSGVWQRFLDRQFEEREFRPTGRFARIYAQTAPWLGWWTYGDFAGRLALQSEDDVLDVACGSGAFLRKHASHDRDSPA
jgi:2-polyprenyl-3-methyl-5-hydroxy-6-metoxy-1,4-benzoquinol methylase